MNLDELILVTGGSVHSSRLPSCVSREQYRILKSWLQYLQQFVDGVSKGAKGPKVTLHFSLSPSLVCRTRTLDDGSVAVLLPLGLPVRVRTFARLLLRYFGQQSGIRLAASLLDDYPESHWRIAPSLVPLFGELADESEHWRLLAILDSHIELKPELETVVNELVWVASCYLTWHEVAHAIRGHFSIVARARSDSRTVRSINEADMRKALEIDADASATMLMLFTTFEKMRADDVENEVDKAFFWIGYAATLVFGLYDTRRKALGLYSQAFYPHPIVRHGLFVDFATAHIAERWPKLGSVWEKENIVGWKECVAALRHLDVDVFTGKFGGNTKKSREIAKFVPVTAMTYNVFDSSFVSEGKHRERALASEVLPQLGLG
jgi:hypothetical protein